MFKLFKQRRGCVFGQRGEKLRALGKSWPHLTLILPHVHLVVCTAQRITTRLVVQFDLIR